MTRLPSSPAPPFPATRFVAIGAAVVAACDDPYAFEAVRVVGAWSGPLQNVGAGRAGHLKNRAMSLRAGIVTPIG